MSAIGSVWDRGSDGGGSVPLTDTLPQWSYLKPAASPHADSDYFDDASLAGAWTEWDPGSLMTVTETTAERLKLVQATHVSQGWAGIVKAAPASTRYCVTVALHMRGVIANYAACGLILGGTDMLSGAATANFVVAASEYKNTAVDSNIWTYTAYDTFDATDGTLSQGAFRLFRWYIDTPGDRIAMLVSNNGNEWLLVNNKILGSANLTGTNPAFIGPGLNNTNTGRDLEVTCDMFRVDVTTNPYLPCGGYIDVGVL